VIEQNRKLLEEVKASAAEVAKTSTRPSSPVVPAAPKVKAEPTNAFLPKIDPIPTYTAPKSSVGSTSSAPVSVPSIPSAPAPKLDTLGGLISQDTMLELKF